MKRAYAAVTPRTPVRKLRRVIFVAGSAIYAAAAENR